MPTLRDLDLFRRNIDLNYNKSNSFTTNVGCFFTLCVIIIAIIQTISTFQTIITFQSPQVTSEHTILKEPSVFSFNSSNFSFAVYIPGLDLSSSFVSVTMQ